MLVGPGSSHRYNDERDGNNRKRKGFEDRGRSRSRSPKRSSKPHSDHDRIPGRNGAYQPKSPEANNRKPKDHRPPPISTVDRNSYHRDERTSSSSLHRQHFDESRASRDRIQTPGSSEYAMGRQDSSRRDQDQQPRSSLPPSANGEKFHYHKR
jgi:hypothetical protein